MKYLFFIIILFSCSGQPLRAPSSDDYHVLIFSVEFENPRPEIIKECDPYSFRKGSLYIKSKVADLSNEGMVCAQGVGQVNFECTNTFKLVKAVLVQGRKECMEIPNDTALEIKRAL